MIPEIRSTSIPSVRPQAQNALPVAQASSTPTQSASDSVEVRPQSSLERLLAATAPDASRLEADLGEHVPGEVLVKLKSQPPTQSQNSFAQRFGATVLERFDFPKEIYQNFKGEMLHLKLPEGMTTAQALAAMQQDPRVEYVMPNNVYTLDDPPAENASASAQGAAADAPKTPNDLKPELWGLNNTGQKGGTPDADIDAPEAWAVTTGNPNGPLIAVIDTGVDYKHPDLVNNIWTNPGEIAGDGIDNDGNGVIDDVHGYNAYAQTGDPMDGHSHGTHCAGSIAAEGNNDQGVVGVNWRARIMPVKIFSDSGSTNSAAIVRGILYATKNGARVTSNSWGGGAADPAIRDAFANSPALHIMAAGNSGSNNDTRPHYPSSYDLPNNIAVAASDRNDRLASFSCYGENSVDLAAPGVEIYSTIPGGGYANKSGTSMATPHVAGAAGLLLASDPTMSNEEIKTRLLEGADKLESLQGKVATGARLNIAKAITMEYEPTEKPTA